MRCLAGAMFAIVGCSSSSPRPGVCVSRIARTLSRTMPSWMRKRVNRVLQPLGTRIPAEDRASSLTEYDYRVRVTQLHQETPRALTITFEMLEGYRLIYRSGDNLPAFRK